MLNRWWLPEGEHLRINSSSFSSTDLEGVEPRSLCQKEPLIHLNPILTDEPEQLFAKIEPLMMLSLAHDVLRHRVLLGGLPCQQYGTGVPLSP